MAPPHTMSPPKRLRPGPLTKPMKHRNITTARLNTSSYFQPPQPIMPGVEETIIDQFCLHREKNSGNLAADLPEDNDTRRRISYTKEQKLAAISYATTTWKAQKDGSLELISKKSASTNLGIPRPCFGTGSRLKLLLKLCIVEYARTEQLLFVTNQYLKSALLSYLLQLKRLDVK